MAKIRIYRGDDAYEVDIAKILNVEAIAVQKVTSLTYQEWLAEIDRGDIGAITGLYWVAMKRTDPDLRYSDVEFEVGDWKRREWLDADADPTQPQLTESE